MAAEAFDNTDGTGSLTLSGANATYADGGSAQTVTVGGTAFSINASRRRDDQRDRAQTTASCSKTASARTPSTAFAQADTLQLQKSMFSYIDPSASQSVDLAAVLSHASSGVNSVTIADTAGDHLTLSGFNSTTLSAASAQITFV